MANRFEDNTRKKALADKYADLLRKRDERLKSSLNAAQYDYYKNFGRGAGSSIHSALENAMEKPDTLPSEYISSKMGWMFGSFIPKRDRDVILYFADRLREYPYSDSYNRRSFRANRNIIYTSKLTNIIRGYANSYKCIIDAPLEDILNRELPEEALAFLDVYAWRGCGYSEWQIAYALDHHNVKVEEAVRSILTDGNCSSRMTSEIIRGVLISHGTDFHRLLGDLLLAARLQEGLRQIICESADSGTKEGFLAILRVIDDNGLIRFSSVKRAVGTWLGLLTEEARELDRISTKSVRLIIDCLDSLEVREEYLSSEDAMKIYIALWSYGFDDIDSAVGKIGGIAESGSVHQLLTAGYFASNIDHPYVSNHIAKYVLKHYRGNGEVLAVWLPCFIPGRVSGMWNEIKKGLQPDYCNWFESKEEIYEYYQLISGLYSEFSGKTKTYSPCVFPWYEATVSKSDLAEILCTLAVMLGDGEAVDEACGLIKECSSGQRQYYFSALLRSSETPIQRKTALEGLVDRETYTRNAAYDIVSKMKLSADEYRDIEGYLRFKSSDIRKFVMELLHKQSDAELTLCISRLIESDREEIRLGGLDMVMQLKKDGKREKIARSFESVLADKAKADDVSAKEKILLGSLVDDGAEKEIREAVLFSPDDDYMPCEFDEEYTERCIKTFTEYFPQSRLPFLIGGKKTVGGLFGRISSALKASAPCEEALAAEADLLSLSKFIDEHKADTFENTLGETVMLGNVAHTTYFRLKNNEMPFMELWKEWMQSNGITDKRLVNAYVKIQAYKETTKFSKACEHFISDVFGEGFECGVSLLYQHIVLSVISGLFETLPQKDILHLGSAIAIWFIKCVPDGSVMLQTRTNNGFSIERNMAHLLAHCQLMPFYSRLVCRNDGELENIFPLAVASAERCIAASKKLQKEDHWAGNEYYYADYSNPRILYAPFDRMSRQNGVLVGANAYLKAAYRGIITEAQLYKFLFDPDNLKGAVDVVTAVATAYYEKGRQISSHDSYRVMSKARKVKEFLGNEGEPNDDDIELIKYVVRIYDTVVPIIVEAELRRGDSPTSYTNGVHSIARIYGAEYFAAILETMGNDTFDRSAFYGWRAAKDRKGSLSYLLSVCIPKDGDSADTLRSALKGKGISAKRLIEAALFSPEWIPIVGEYLNINSFESVCYYFMAHMNERFDDKRRAVIARFTPLSEDELNLGAFDVTWFRAAYGSVGEKEFNMIYDAAKYISSGAKHTRARKYADASLGRYDTDETEKAISDKRNKDLLMAYALIPLEGEDDICRRYLFIQNFRKESKQFGSQRAVSEGKAVEMALTNLAINAGYSDTMRLTLRMETKVIDDSRALLEEQTVDGVSFKIQLDENGKAALVCAKDGKVLKSVPSKLKKNEAVASLTLMVKTLTEQYRRSRLMLERAMEDCTFFTFGELSALSAHPVVYPMLKNLVFISGNAVGFIADKGLRDCTGEVLELEEGDEVRIAHPFDLYSKGCWRDYQKHIFENRITQPFRQVFRELYVKTEEENGMFHSLRYAGNQIQPAKTVGALKARRWVADVEDGLQKVYYKENIVARIYALADWFSPADIEAPTLEWVSFTNRRTEEEIRIADVPHIVFSEVMRDVDLAVSIAHAGGVDPETSHSTMEMRAAILSFVLPMFRIENVKVEGRYAIVDGKLAEYSIHLGCGVVHQLGGAMIPVLPVHSQHRGRIFLPFADDDPKTAEIISKVLLFAEDSKIKDPMILSAISK